VAECVAILASYGAVHDSSDQVHHYRFVHPQLFAFKIPPHVFLFSCVLQVAAEKTRLVLFASPELLVYVVE